MKHLFVSSERVIQQNYRYGSVFRLAGALLLLGAFSQAPILLIGINTWRYCESQSAEQRSLKLEAESLRAAEAPLKEVKQKLNQIHQWEPILRSRLPVSALLNAVQISIPTTAVLDSLSIETEQFDRHPVSGGTYRVPEEYRVVLQGVGKQGAEDVLQEFNDALLRRLPAGSEVVRSEYLDKRTDGLVPFILQYAVKPSGNYFGLGLKRIAEPDTL
jgi:hypothetical protein